MASPKDTTCPECHLEMVKKEDLFNSWQCPRCDEIWYQDPNLSRGWARVGIR